MLNAGKYIARIAELAWQESRNGNTYLLARFGVTQGDCAGQTCTKSFFFADAALERTVEDLRVCGWQGTNPADITIEDVGAEVSITVDHEQYTDANTGEEKTTARVKWVNPLAQALKTTADATKVQSFGKGLAARIAALDARSRASGTARPAPSAPQQRPTSPAQHRPAAAPTGFAKPRHEPPPSRDEMEEPPF